LPSNYVFPIISELVLFLDLPALLLDERIRSMADKMQAPTDSIKGELCAILTSSSAPVYSTVPPTDATNALFS
jgi:hypothetical protein